MPFMTPTAPDLVPKTQSAKPQSLSTSVELVECSPVQIVENVLDMFQTAASAKGLDLAVHWRPGIPPIILSDPHRLEQILVHLIGNAVRLSKRGEVRVDVQTLPACSPGRPPALQFAITDSANSTAASLRDGLVVCRELALCLGGDVSVANNPGFGNTFTLRIAAGTPVGVAAETTCVSPRITGRLLLADDGPDNRRLIATLLRKAGALVDVVENGQQAVLKTLAALKDRQPYDLILMDMVMPEKDGFAATRELRQAGYPGRILALTADNNPDTQSRCHTAGCDDIATKPISQPALITVVSKWLS
jgi:CheY-like chemotaxis protein